MNQSVTKKCKPVWGKDKVLALARRRWVTPQISLRECGLMALSQAMTKARTALDAAGFKILSVRVKGESFHKYRIVPKPKGNTLVKLPHGLDWF